ncbi:hypothetical protein [Phyllobacterium salinisoli]|uniref:hypothetical protein n=1 Tax=Phyllobacterium salinisoli TaxID=1899321 RepID=UPI0011C05BB7|nr:hypothetical protein [Phyllobacterium salinisoli]
MTSIVYSGWVSGIFASVNEQNNTQIAFLSASGGKVLNILHNTFATGTDLAERIIWYSFLNAAIIFPGFTENSQTKSLDGVTLPKSAISSNAPTLISGDAPQFDEPSEEAPIILCTVAAIKGETSSSRTATISVIKDGDSTTTDFKFVTPDFDVGSSFARLILDWALQNRSKKVRLYAHQVNDDWVIDAVKVQNMGAN